MKRNAKETEKKILQAAINIFSKKGFSAATTSEIAKEAKVAEGTIFKYYPKKKELLHAAMVEMIELFGESIAIDSLKKVIQENEDQSIEIILKAIVLDRITLFQDHLQLIKVIFYEMQFHKDIKELFLSKVSKNGIPIFAQIFEKGKKQGQFKDINSLIAMRSFMGMIIFMLLQREFLYKENAFENIEEEVDVLIDIFLNGIKRG
ncbi:TetR/AcrR family transcriptional regulator [Lutibacter sp. B2]|nr:TetR/AcrR family transcriptional regulator [Lutibacter sp. B2]